MIWLSVAQASPVVLAMCSLTRTFAIVSKNQQSKKPAGREQISRSNFVRMAFHSSTVAGNTVYIDGGEITLSSGDDSLNPQTTTQNQTLTIDLSKSWTTSEIEYGFINKDSSVPVLNYGALWTSLDNTSVLSFGGVRSSFPYSLRIANVELWKYSVGSGWSGITSQSPASPSLTNSRPAVAASTYGNGVGYMLGGIRGNDNAPWWPLPGLLTYNMAQNTWSNESTVSAMPYSLIGGSLTYVPGFGDQGVLVAMGGEYTGAKAWMETATNFVPLTNISIWDIASKTWFWQNATANNNPTDIPPPATMFCSTSIQGQNGTFEIYIYGGHNDTFALSSKTPSDMDRTTQHAFNTVHVLSLPGFVWTRVDAGTAASRTGHTCNVIGNSQMLSIGGLNPQYKFQDAQGLRDDFANGLGIFDMVDLKWTTTYNANAPNYTTPALIQKWYDTSTMRAPVDWSSPDIETIFSRSPNAAVPDSHSTMGPANNAFIPAIVGSVLGTVLFAVLALFWYRRYRERRKKEAPPDGDAGIGDIVGNDMPSHLKQTREPYLAQRHAFLHQNEEHPSAATTIVGAPGSLLNSRRGSYMPQDDTDAAPKPAQHIENHTVALDSTPGLWSAAQYPDHPAFTGSGSRSASHEENRELHDIELCRIVHGTALSDSSYSPTSFPNSHTGSNDRHQLYHPVEHGLPDSKWSSKNTSPINITAPQSSSPMPIRAIDDVYEADTGLYHEAATELE